MKSKHGEATLEACTDAEFDLGGAMVTKDVPPGMVVAGIPARVIRERASDGRHGDDLDHIWLY